MDNGGFHCPARKPNHIENVQRDNACKVMEACMKAAHTSMTDVTGAQSGWILAKQLSKPLSFIQQQEQYRQMSQQGPGQHQQYPQKQRRGQQQKKQWEQQCQ